MEEQKGLPLLELKTAYQSLRESGFDFSTAIGELIDNSVQAEAKRIDIIPKIDGSVITQISVVDDGDGMDEETLNGCPQLGFSTRYNDREGLGRFGVGATYASISQCKRTTFCSRSKGTGNFLATYIDLDEIAT
ncbi:MAG: ATP-binding protein [Candidatus Poribacteria bacterium]|nr:ATP-binding protein [Candidatus Poribacteria bacterium]